MISNITVKCCSCLGDESCKLLCVVKMYKCISNTVQKNRLYDPTAGIHVLQGILKSNTLIVRNTSQNVERRSKKFIKVGAVVMERPMARETSPPRYAPYIEISLHTS